MKAKTELRSKLARKKSEDRAQAGENFIVRRKWHARGTSIVDIIKLVTFKQKTAF